MQVFPSKRGSQMYMKMLAGSKGASNGGCQVYVQMFCIKGVSDGGCQMCMQMSGTKGVSSGGCQMHTQMFGTKEILSSGGCRMHTQMFGSKGVISSGDCHMQLHRQMFCLKVVTSSGGCQMHTQMFCMINQQWRLPDPYANVVHQVQGRQQWGMPDVHANLLHQGRQQWGMPDVHANILHQGSQQWVQPGQSPTTASVDASHFLNPSYPGDQQYNSRVFQHQRSPFSGGMCSMDRHQHQYLQNRHPWSSQRYAATGMNTGGYDQWHQTPPPQQHGSRTYQWEGFQDFGRQSNNMPRMHAGRSVLLSASHPVGIPQMSSPTTGSDGSVTSFLVPPSGYQYPLHGNGIC